MAAPKPYKYGNQRIGADTVRIGAVLDTRKADKEFLTGAVQGIKASDLEERVARSLSKDEKPFEFRFRITSALQGQQRLTRQFLNETGEVEIDFLVSNNGAITPIFIDGEIGHFFTEYQADKDAVKTNVTNEFGASMGWRPAVRVPFWKLVDQETTDQTMREIFSAEWVSTRAGIVTTNAGAITNTGSGYVWAVSGTVTEQAVYGVSATINVKAETTSNVLRYNLETNTRILRHNLYMEAGGFR